MNQFSTQVDEQGNLLITPGAVIDATAATTEYHQLGVNFIESIGRGQGLRKASPYAPFFVGGSGESVEVAATVTTPAIAPIGYFERTGEFEWTDRFGNVLTMLSDYSDGDISDATDVIATLSAPVSGIDVPWIFNATTYGEDEFNGGTPFDFTANHEVFSGGGINAPNFINAYFDEFSSGGTFPNIGSATDGEYYFPLPDYTLVYNTGAWELRDSVAALLDTGGSDPSDPTGVYNDGTYDITVTVQSVLTTAAITITTGTAQSGNYIESAWNTWTSEDDSNWTLEIQVDTTSEISDGTDIVAIRPAGSARIPSGNYASTTYGANTYNDGAEFTMAIDYETRFPLAGFAYVEIELSAGAFVAASGPFFASTLPANSATLEVVPIAHSNGAGTITPICDGPIIFR